MRNANYDKVPATKVDGTIITGWDSILAKISSGIYPGRYIVALDTYTGVYLDEIRQHFRAIGQVMLVEMADLYKLESEIVAMTEQFITDDVLFGRRSTLTIDDYFDTKRVTNARLKIKNTNGLVVILGTGAARVAQSDCLIYADMARWEIQQRFRTHSIKALGIDNSMDAVSLQYKRGYFNDWQVCDRHKQTIYGRVDYWLDTHVEQAPKMIDRETFLRGIRQTVNTPFRVVPFFDPAPWGGQWMKQVCGLNPEKANYGWCFDCVPEENSLMLDIAGTLFEMPSINLVLTHPQELLGSVITAHFGAEFPIRFDLLDTIGGGNLSLQVHPTDEYIKEHFGMPYTQHESYYILDAEPGAEVYLGVKSGIAPTQMVADLRRAALGELAFDPERYINRLSAQKHDHYLIPGGTIHCSGAGALVLEISATPNLFTFKLWDWQRLGLDGKPRPINVEHGKNVIQWERDTEYVKSRLANIFTHIASGDGWYEESTGLYEAEFIETRRHWFTNSVAHDTCGNLHVLNLIEGDEVIVESPEGCFEPFVVHYAETFIVPAHIGAYTITPYGKSEGRACATIKAYVRS